MEVELAAPIGPEIAAATTSQAAGRLLGLERDGHLRIVRTIADLDAAREDGVLAAVMHHEGAEAIDPGLEALELWYAAGPALARAGVEPPERVRPRRPVRVPRLARHRPRPHRRPGGARAPLRGARHRGRPQPPQRGRLLGRRAAGRRAADRLALRRARAVRLDAQPHRRAARRDRRLRRARRHRVRRAVRARRRRRRRRHAARRRSSPTSATPPTASGSSTSRSARTSTARRCPTSSATSPGCRGSSTRSPPAASPRTRSARSRWDNWRRVLARAWRADGAVPFVGVRTDPTDTGGLFVGRRPGTAPTRYARRPSAAAAARRRARRAPRPRAARAHGRPEPPVLGPDPGRRAVGRLAGPVPDRQRQLGHPARASARCSRRCSPGSRSSSGWTARGSSCGARPASTSAAACSAACSGPRRSSARSASPPGCCLVGGLGPTLAPR